MKYVSVCAGIEAATVAWHPLGWEPVLFSEIEPFPCAVLKHHYPQVTLVGDFTQLILNPPEVDLLVGGTPCQAFSVAGKRLSLEDYRGNLSLAFADLFHAGQYRWAVWENVPGVLSTKDNAFGCLLGRLVGSDAPLHPSRGNRWTNAGVVSGPLATAAWRVLDAQYFGVAQRRRRVFVCVSRGAGNWAAAAALLPVGESVSRHPPARRQAGENTPADASTSVGSGQWWDGSSTAQTISTRSNDQLMPDRGNCGGQDRPTVTSKWAKGSGGPAGAETGNLVVEGGGWPAAVAPTLNAAFAEKQGLEDQHINGGAGMFVLDKQGGQVTEGVSPTLKTDLSHQMGPVVAVPQVLRNREGKEGGGKGPLLSEDQSLTLGTANDQVVFAIQERAVSENPANGPQGSGIKADGTAYTLEARHHAQAVFALQNPGIEKAQNGLGISDGPMYSLESSRPHGVVAPSVTGGPPFSRTGNERVEAEALVVAMDAHNGTLSDTHHTLGTNAGGMGAGAGGRLQLRPRRLTPRECERLQGFPDDYTLIPWRKGMSPDGPRYKALGNSMAVPVMNYIGKRIQLVETTND